MTDRRWTGWTRPVRSRSSIGSRRLRARVCHALFIAALFAPLQCLAQVTEVDGVQLPVTAHADGKILHLNGAGLRTYSILGVHIYVAGLYLERPSTDADAVMRSPETKLLKIRFVRNVGAEAARNAWRTGLQDNCRAPCQLDPQDVARFLADVPAMHAGERYSFLFTPQGARITADGRPLGTITKPQFAAALLATFLGPAAASPALRAELLQGHG